jgi:hypothetical protein
MSDNLTTGLVTIVLGILSVATIAVIFSPKAQTAQVATAAGNAFGYDLGIAISPVTGSTPQSLSSSL